MLSGCTPRTGEPMLPFPTASPTPGPTPSSEPTPEPRTSTPAPSPSPTPTPTGPAPTPDVTVPERPDDVDALPGAPGDEPPAADPDSNPDAPATPTAAVPSERCTDDLVAWIVEDSALVADEQVTAPVPSDPAVDLGGLTDPGCAFTGSSRVFTDIEEVEAAADVRVWVFTDAESADAHAEAALSALGSAGYGVFDRRAGSDPLTHLVREEGTEVLDQALVQTWRAPSTVQRVGAEPGQVVVAVGVVTFTGLG